MIVDVGLYRDGERRAGDVPIRDASETCRLDDHFTWIGLHEPTEEEFSLMRQEFSLHELAVEDAVKAHQRPKMEIYGDSLFVVLKTARYMEEAEEIQFGEILLFIGKDFVITVRHGEASALAEVRKSVEKRPDLLKLGTTVVLHAILDRVVDDYGPVIAGVEADIEEVEEEVFSHVRTNPTERIYFLKRQVLEFHRAAAPLLPALDQLARGRQALVPEKIHHYFRDVHDHLMRIVDQVEGHRDLLTSVLEANLTQVSIRQNADMRRISAWVAILAVPTLVAGIYGMNFKHIPELEHPYGYQIALGGMLTVCSTMWFFFRRAGWL
jgi:magnesium transporter